MWHGAKATAAGRFEHFRHGHKQPQSLAQGLPFSGDRDGLYELVVGVLQRTRMPVAKRGQSVAFARTP